MPEEQAGTDMRGGQGRLKRLSSFDKEALLHMVAYRVASVYVTLYGITLLASFFVHVSPVGLKIATAALWLLVTPQLYETSKGLAMSGARGLAFGHLNAEYSSLMKSKYHTNPGAYRALVYLVAVLWAAGFVVMLVWWPI